MIRKKCVLIGTCQLDAISKILNNSRDFMNQYEIHKIIMVHVESEKEINNFFDNGIDDTDLIIAQPISQKYRKGLFSTKRLKKKSNCKIIMIPFLYFTGYFPSMTYIKDEQNKKITKYEIVYHDFNIIKNLVEQIEDEFSEEYLEDLLDQDVCNNNIYNLLNNDKYYSESYLQKTVTKSIKNLELREMFPYDYEKSVDIKMSSYIKNNYEKYRLFNTMNHPSNILLLETTKKILNMLKINNQIEISDEEYLGDAIFPIYPSVTKNLKLNFSDSGYIKKRTLTFEKFVKLYISFYFKNIKIKTLIHNYLIN